MDLIRFLLDVPSVCQWDYWNGVFQNAIGCSLGSGAAIYVAWLIYRKQSKDNEDSALNAIKIKEENQLKSFALMLQNALKMAQKQADYIEQYIGEIKKQPTPFPKITLTPLGNLKIILDSITVEKTGLAYMKYFSSDNSAKEFTTIMDAVDYLNTEFKELQGLIGRATMNDFDRRKEFSKAFDICNKLVLDFIIRDADMSKDTFTIKIKEIKFNFDKNRGSVDNIQSINDLFFIPLSNFLLERLNRGQRDDFSIELNYWVSRGIEYYENILHGYNQFESEMVGIQKEVGKNIAKLESASSKILQSKYIALEIA